MKTSGYSPGLEGVIAAETAISFLDTENEKIVIRGEDLIALSREKGYIDVAYLLLEGKLPDAVERKRFEEHLKNNYQIPETVTSILQLLPKNTHPMDGQRTALSALAGFDSDLDDRSAEKNKKRAIQLLGMLPAITVNSYQILNGQKPVEPRTDLSYSGNFLYMITGKVPTKQEEEIFDQLLLLYSEHEMPNSTFAARIIASTQSDMYGALTGAVASLKGNLHGGANEAVMVMLNEAESAGHFVELIKEKLQRKEKIMGFGHRVYMKKFDPRALVMKEALYRLCQVLGDFSLYEKCEAGEQLMEQEKGIYPNLDYYAAPVYWLLGVPIPLYTPIFFSSRVAGLCAHIIEQQENNRIFRPRVKYTGKRYS